MGSLNNVGEVITKTFILNPEAPGTVLLGQITSFITILPSEALRLTPVICLRFRV